MISAVRSWPWRASLPAGHTFALWTPPLGRREFWVVQGLVVAIALGHAFIEWSPALNLHGAEFLPVSLYLLPVVYAALNFGMRGAAPTAIWTFLLTLPNIALWHAGPGALGELWQAIMVVGVGLFVGRRVDRERHAMRDAEIRERERRASEARYRGLFNVAADSVLVIDEADRIVDANAAALSLVGRTVDDVRGASVGELLPGLRRAFRNATSAVELPLAIERPGGRRWVEPVAVPFLDADGQRRILAQLRDVTFAVERQQLLESFARRTVAAREEERRRVARDLHDGPLQALMLLWRSLDDVERSASDRSRDMLAAARRRAEEVADELRRFSRDLRPSVLDDLGLAPALKAETSASAARAGAEITFGFTGISDRLPSEVELTLLRICQEALRNIERHARARRATVLLERGPVEYRLLIADDGVGAGQLPPPAELLDAGRLGIVGMQERAKLIGASCTVHRSPPWSTVVEVVGPADGHPDAPLVASGSVPSALPIGPRRARDGAGTKAPARKG